MKDTPVSDMQLSRGEKVVRLLIALILMGITLALVINYEAAVKSSGASYYTSLGSDIFAYAFHFFPMLVTSAVCGAAMSVFLWIVLAVYYVIIQPEMVWMVAIYMVAGVTSYNMGVAGFYAKKRGWISSMIITTLILGPLWGGILGMAAGRGFLEFMPRKFLMYFLNEFPEVALSYTVLRLVLTKLPKRFRKLLFCGDFADEGLINNFVLAQRSRIGTRVGQLVLVMIGIMGLFTVISANSLTPAMFMSGVNGEVTRVIQNADIDFDRILNTGALLHLANDLLEMMPSVTVHLDPSSIDIIAFDTKLVLLILVFAIPVSVLTSFYAQIRLSLPVIRLKQGVDSLMSDGDENAEEALARFKNIDIRSGDEIEALFHAYENAMERIVRSTEVAKHAKELETDLEIAKAASEAKTNFLSNMSHEIRTPINAMLGFDVMILRESNEPATIEYANNINNAGRMLLGLINDVLDFSRIESGRMEIIPVEYAPEALLNETVEMAMSRVREKNLSLNTMFNPQIPRSLYGDDKRIKQCLTNILTNAVKYTDEGGIRITSTFRKIDEENIGFRISVIDTGIGIRKEDMEKLFSPFERIDEKRNRTIEGAGLGLNIVNKLLELMGTKLDVESTYGEGSVFSFEVKQKVISWEPMGIVNPMGAMAAAQADAAGAPAGAGMSAGPAGGPPPGVMGGPPPGVMGGPPGSQPKRYHTTFQAPDAKVLVVDDTPVNLKVVEGLLRQTLIQVDEAFSGDEAIEKAAATRYDIIFMDHRMPEKDGVETFHELRAMENCASKDSPVIALTANVISGAREMFKAEGFSDFLSKPVDPGAMEDVIMHFLPQEMIVREGEEGFDTEAINRDMGGPEAGIAIRKLLSLKGIDQAEGSRNCGGPRLHVEALQNFYMSIDKRSENIEKYEKEGDLKNYIVEVHGLKSSSRVVGATELSGKAAHLEACGEEGDIEQIKQLTPELLEQYRQYKEWLKPILDEDDDTSKPLIPADELESALMGIKEYVEAGLYDEADDIIKQLSEYRIPDESKEKVEKIRIRLAAVDRDGLLKLL